jgi:hypothetical protein
MRIWFPLVTMTAGRLIDSVGDEELFEMMKQAVKAKFE